MYNVYKNYNDIFYNQIRIKLLYKSTYNYQSCSAININLDLFKLKSINSDFLWESVFFIEFFSNCKTYVNYYKKTFKEYNVQFANTLRKKYLLDFIYLLNLFYFPVLIRRNLFFPKKLSKSNQFTIPLNNLVAMFPFLPNVYFKRNQFLNVHFIFKKLLKPEVKLFLLYWNFLID